MTIQTQLSTIQFHNQTLTTFEQNNIHYVAMRPICENIGLEWGSQYNRVKRDEVLNSVIFIMKTTGSDGKEYQMLCLPIDYLNGWLFGIDVKRVKPEIRETLIMYKKECYQALANYWMKGKAERKTTTDERTGLRQSVSQLVSRKGMLYSDAYGLIHQRFNVAHIDELSREQIPQAVEYVHKLILEGELIVNEPPALPGTFNLQLTEQELKHIARNWVDLKFCIEVLELVAKPLQQLGSYLGHTAHSHAVEYGRDLRESQATIDKITSDFKMDKWRSITWCRTLPHIRHYSKKQEQKRSINLIGRD